MDIANAQGSADTSTLATNLLGNFASADPLAASIAKRDQHFADLLAAANDAKETLADITQGGASSYWKWKMKQLKEEITQQVMGEMKVTPEQLAQLPLEDRLALEQKIHDAVEERLKMAISEEMKRKQKTVLGFNPLASPSSTLIAQGLDNSAATF